MKLLISLVFLVLAFSSCKQAPSHEQLTFPWKPYSKQAVEDSIAHHRPVVIDFFAEWCPYCHELDRTLFNRPDVQAKLAKMTALRMDMTDQEDQNVQDIAQLYQVDGLPTIVFLDSRGKEVNNSRLIGFVTPEDFNQAYALLNLFK